MAKKDRFFEQMDALGLALTYDDVRLKTGYSATMPQDISLATKFSRNIPLQVPVVSAAMDTVTGHGLATELARRGGLGVLHRNFPPEEQARQVKRVKEHLNALIESPRCVYEDESIEAILFMQHEEELGFHSFPVLDRAGKLVGVLTRNDFDFCDDHSKTAKEAMTREVLTGSEDTTLDQAYALMRERKKKVLPLINAVGEIRGLYILSDVLRVKSGESKHSNLDDKGRLRVAAAIGTGESAYQRAEHLRSANVDVLVIDTAHGDSQPVYDTLRELKQEWPETDIVVGNISEPASAARLCEAGADGLKIGQGPGCFAAGTRILMASGVYANIEDIQQGDRIIGGDGQPATVKKAWCTGVRPVVSMSHTQFYTPTFVTDDHRYWVGDLNSVSASTLRSSGYRRQLEKRTRGGESKFKWKPLSEIKQDVALLPRNVQFEMKKTFHIPLTKRQGGNGTTHKKRSVDATLTPSYELGYIFGLFLGDGSTHQATVKHGTSNIGSTRWYFGENEEELAKKLISALKRCFPHASVPLLKPPTKQKKTHKVLFFYKPLADFLVRFGKKTNKHLPADLLVYEHKYLQGLFDGLIESDGHRDANGRVNFTNTSPQLLELFGTLSYLVMGVFPSFTKPREPSAGGLQNCDVANCAPSYRARLALRREKRLTESYQICKLRGVTQTQAEVPVYDLEIDADHHSFIANNCIVHNSICTTRVIAGIGSPQVSAVYQCSKVAEAHGVPVCADGGLRYSGDLTIAIGAGAHTVMMGGMLAGTDEAPGHKVFLNGRQWKSYRGMGSLGAMLDSRSSRERYRQSSSEHRQLIPEGVEGLVPYKGPLEDVLVQYLGGLRAGMGYVGAANIEELREKADFHRVTAAGKAESHPHDIQITKESPNYSGMQGGSKSK